MRTRVIVPFGSSAAAVTGFTSPSPGAIAVAVRNARRFNVHLPEIVRPARQHEIATSKTLIRVTPTAPGTAESATTTCEAMNDEQNGTQSGQISPPDFL